MQSMLDGKQGKQVKPDGVLGVGYISIISLNLKIPLAFITPLTPSGMRYAQSATPNVLAFAFAGSDSLSGCPVSSDVSATKTRPSSLIVSTRAGTTFYKEVVVSMVMDTNMNGNSRRGEGRGRTKRLDRQIIPMKLLLWAIRADSLIDIEARPLLST